MRNRTGPVCCETCGVECVNRFDRIQHRALCEKLEAQVLEEVKRIAEELGRTPYSKEWTKYARPGLPTLAWIAVKYDGWKAIVTAAGLDPGHMGTGRPPQSGTLPPTRYYWQEEDEATKEYGNGYYKKG